MTPAFLTPKPISSSRQPRRRPKRSPPVFKKRRRSRLDRTPHSYRGMNWNKAKSKHDQLVSTKGKLEQEVANLKVELVDSNGARRRAVQEPRLVEDTVSSKPYPLRNVLGIWIVGVLTNL